MIRSFALGLALVAGVAGVLDAGNARAQAQIGSLAPDFTLTGNDGVPYTLSDYRTAPDRHVVLLWMVGYA